ncbi:hypothetical protein Tco_0572545 [Tanacetum coccineum]
MVISSPCLTDIKNWLVQSKRLLLASPKQTALGKDISNPLIVDSLLKTIWLSMHHVIAMKHWLFQSKRLLLEKSEGNAEFHEVIDFLARSSIYHALTCNPTSWTTNLQAYHLETKFCYTHSYTYHENLHGQRQKKPLVRNRCPSDTRVPC